MKSIITILTLLALCTSLHAQSKTEREITELSRKRVKWLLENNIDSLAILYDENSITVHGNGMVRTAADHLADVKAGRPTYKSIEIKEMSVRDFGSTAILVGNGIFNITINGSDMNANMAYTEVYMKRGNKWKLIARHASQIQ